MTARWLALCLLVAGCSTLPDIANGTCGNGVIDPDEDCDGGSGCDRCQLICAADQSCPLDGYACGVDVRCHATSGKFHQAPSTVRPFAGTAGQVADVNADGIGDVLELTGNAATMAYGDLEGRLDQELATMTPTLTGAIELRGLGTGAEILLPTGDGIAAYIAQDHQPQPYPFTIDPSAHANCAGQLAPGDSAELVVALDPAHLVIALHNEATDAVKVALIDLASRACTVQPACGLTISRGLPVVDTYDTSRWSTPRTSLLAIGDDALNTCVLRASLAPGSPTLTQVASLQDTASARFAATTATGCPSLFALVGGAARERAGIAAAPTTAGCALAATTVPVVVQNSGTLEPGAAPFGRIALVPPVAGAGPDALLFTATPDNVTGSSTIYASIGGELAAMFHASVPINTLAVGNIDGDPSTLEGVATAPFVVLALYRAGDVFLPYQIPTAGFPQTLLAADFDGNGIDDIAYLELANTGTQLQVAFGTQDRPLAPALVRTFPDRVSSLAALDVRDSLDPTGVIADLAVLHVDPMRTAAITVFHGSPQRMLLSYFDPRFLDEATTTAFSALSAGAYGIGAGDVADLLAVQYSSPGGKAPTRIWHIPGTAGGGLDASAIGYRLVRSDGQTCPGCLAQPHVQPWPIAEGRDVALAVDEVSSVTPQPQRTFQTMVIDPSKTGGTAVDPTQLADLTGPQLTARLDDTLRASIATDVDGDSRRELVLAFGPSRPVSFFGSPGGNTQVCGVDDTGHLASCTALAGPDGWVCNDADHGALVPRGRHDPASSADPDELVTLCHQISPDGMEYSATAVFRIRGTDIEQLVTVPASAEFVLLGDVTGDTLADLLVIAFDKNTNFPQLYVYPQCDARDVACREGAQ